MLHLKKFEGLFSGGKNHKVFPKRTPEEIEAENKLREEEKKKQEEEALQLKKASEEKLKASQLLKLKTLVTPLLDFFNSSYGGLKFKESFVYLDTYGVKYGKSGTIHLESNLDFKKHLELSPYKPNIESLTCKLKFNIDINSSSIDFIKVDSYSIHFESNLTWDSNSVHDGFYSKNQGGYFCSLSRSYPKWKFETSTGTNQPFDYRSRDMIQGEKTNLNRYSITSKIESLVLDHLKLTFLYCGIDEHNKKYLDKLETVKDNLDYIYYCFSDISDIAKDTTEPYISEPKKDSSNRIVDNKIIIIYNFQLDIGITSVVDGINLKLTKKLTSIFDSLAEAKPRILDIIPDAEIDIDLLSKKNTNQYTTTANPTVSILKVFITIPVV
jgi:hypothetical protein